MSGLLAGGLSWQTSAACMLAVAAAGLLRGFTGFGFGLAATPLLALVLPPSDIVPMVLLLQVASTFVGLPSTLSLHDRRSTWLVGAAAVLTTPLGVVLLRALSPAQARGVVALTAGSAVIVLGSGFRFSRSRGALFPVPFGLAAGLLAGLCAMPGPPVLTYYLGTRAPPAAARASMILIFCLTGLAALAACVGAGLVTRPILVFSLLALPALAAGTAAGAALFRRAPEGIYRPVGIAALALIALGAGIRAVF